MGEGKGEKNKEKKEREKLGSRIMKGFLISHRLKTTRDHIQ